MLAEYLGWPQATFAGSIKSEDDKALVVGREVEGGTAHVRVTLPAVVTVIDKIVKARSVASKHTPAAHAYPEGVRFAALMAIMAAKKKPLAELKLADLAADGVLKVKYGEDEMPPKRAAGVKVKDVKELVAQAQDGSEGDLDMAGTLVVAELFEGQVRKATHSAIAFARQAGGPFAILAIGAGAASAAKDLDGLRRPEGHHDRRSGARGLHGRALRTVGRRGRQGRRLRHRRGHGVRIRQGPRAAPRGETLRGLRARHQRA